MQMPLPWDVLDRQMPRGGPGGMGMLGFDSCITPDKLVALFFTPKYRFIYLENFVLYIWVIYGHLAISDYKNTSEITFVKCALYIWM